MGFAELSIANIAAEYSLGNQIVFELGDRFKDRVYILRPNYLIAPSIWQSIIKPVILYIVIMTMS